MATNTVQSTGSFSMAIANPNVNGGIGMTVKGIKLDGTFITSAQDIDNSKRIALVDGGTAALTNAIRMGKLTVTAMRVGTIANGDLLAYADSLKQIADSIGSTITVSYQLNGLTRTFSFLFSTLVSAPPLIIAGNDLPDYSVIFSYADYSVS